MRIINWIKALPVLIFVFICVMPVNSQVPVERSKDKVIISGVAYYIHQVKKSETAYSISKAYGITVDQLNHENPSALSGIKEGQSLRIPVNAVSSVKPPDSSTVKKTHDDSRFIYHNLKPGETIYSLSKVFGVTENEIIQSNPGLEISKLSVGTELAIPKKVVPDTQIKAETTQAPKKDLETKPEADKQGQGYVLHKVLQGETLSSIARQYDISLKELKKANKDVKFPQVGDYIKVPGNFKPEPPPQEKVVTDTVVPTVAAVPAAFDRTTGYTVVKDLKGTFDVAILLPFYLPQNERRVDIDSSKVVKGKKIYKVNKVTNEWIYPATVDFLELYQGILLASDTLSSQGLNINLHTFDIGDSVEISKLLKTNKLADMDLIIGPVYSDNLAIVSSYAANLGIPVVSPVQLINNSALHNNPTLFMASSSLEITQRAIARKIAEGSNENIVFIHSDTSNVDEDVKRFRYLINSELSRKTPGNHNSFREFLFKSRSIANEDSINNLIQVLSDHSRNIIVLATEDAPVISEVIDDIGSLAKKYDIKVIGYPVIRELDRLDLKELFDMDMMVYAPSWIDYSKMNVKQFNASFRKKFNTEPLEKSYAWLGYDITYYFLSGLAMHGKSFIEHPEIHYPELLENEFDFRRNGGMDGFENQKLYLIHYTKNYDVVLENNP
jgi:LysM repeat protein